MSVRESAGEWVVGLLRLGVVVVVVWAVFGYCQDRRESTFNTYEDIIREELFFHLSDKGMDDDRAHELSREYADVARRAIESYDPPSDWDDE